MNVVIFPLVIYSSTSSKQTPLPPQPFLGIKAGEWPEGVGMTQPSCSGLDEAVEDKTGEHAVGEVLSCYQLVAMEASAPSALLRMLLWLQPRQ